MKKQLGILFVVSIMALAGVSAGYAHWTDTLNIQADVTTGDVEIKIAADSNVVSDPDYGIPDHHSDGLSDRPYSYPDPEGKDVANMVSSISADLKTVTVTFNNAYPKYYGDASIWIENTGTIPVKLQYTDVYYEGVKVGSITASGFIPASTFGGNFEVRYGDNFGVQLHPGDSVEISFMFRLTNDATQTHTYTFGLVPTCCQWFEY